MRSANFIPCLPREVGGVGLPPRNRTEMVCHHFPKPVRIALFSMLFGREKFNPRFPVEEIWSFREKTLSRNLARSIELQVDKVEILDKDGKI